MVPVWRSKSGSDLGSGATLDLGKYTIILLFSSLAAYEYWIYLLVSRGAEEPALEFSALASPLSSLGIWLLSLFFLQAKSAAPGTARLLQIGVLIYIFVYALKAPPEFLWGSIALLSWMAWPLSLALELVSRKKTEIPRVLMTWAFLMALFLAPLACGYPQFLAPLPLSAAILAGALYRLRKRYPKLPALWVYLPLLWLMASAIFAHVQLANYHVPYGLEKKMISRIDVAQENR